MQRSATSIDPDLKFSFRMGMRRLASGVSIVTTCVDGHRYGMVATSTTSLSDDPASLLVCVNRTSSSYLPFVQSGMLCVNVLSQAQKEIADRFASKERREERFEVGTWTALSMGAPALDDCLVSFDCRIQQSVRYSTHEIFICAINSIHMPEQVEPALVYINGLYSG